MNNRFTYHSQKRNAGVTLIELGIVLLVISAFSIGVYSKAVSIGDEARLYRALDDIMLLLTKSTSYKYNESSYKDITVTKLNEEGYSTDPIGTGSGENPWGLDYSLEPVNSDANLKLSVGTSSEEICKRLSANIDKLVVNPVAASSCGGDDNDLLSITVR